MTGDDISSSDGAPQNLKPGAENPEALADAELDDAQGAGLMGTPVGGWGVTGDPQPAVQTLSNVLKNRTQTSSTAIRSIN